MKRPRWLRNGWFALRYALGSSRTTYPVLKLAPAPYTRVMVKSGMDACIEGLPRSATTFGTIGFFERNPDVRLAHHMHVPAQVDRAVRLGVPCAVLIRKPLPNLTSLVLAGENDLEHDLVFRIYMHYYRRILRVRDQVALCTFDEVLEDPSVIGRRLNALRGTAFNADPLTADDKRNILDWLDRGHREAGTRPLHSTVPTEYKEGLKPAVTVELARHPLLPAAEALYAEAAAGVGA